MKTIFIFLIAALCSMLPGLVTAGEEWTSGPDARLVLGQPTFLDNASGDGDSGFDQPWDVAVDGATGKIFVADTGNNRVLRFASFSSISNDDPAEIVLGQADFDTTSIGTGQGGMNFPTGLLVDSDGNLWVSDAGNNRVLRFDDASNLGSGALPAGVLGQSDFMGSGNAVTATNFNSPRGLAMDSSGNLFVADPGNSRVLMFPDAANLANGAAATIVFGQEEFDDPGLGTDRDGFYVPNSVAVDANGSLWVADGNNNRVLRFDNASSKASGADADGVLGQDDFTTVGGGTEQGRFAGPQGIVVDEEGTLWVSEFSNQRVQGFKNAATLADGALSDLVVGQTDFMTFNAGPTASAVSVLRGLSLDTDGRLYVMDNGNRRLLVFEKDRYLPDFTVGEKSNKQKGGGVYNGSGSGQKKSLRTDNKKVKFVTYLENDGNLPDSYLIKSRKTNSKWQIKVFEINGGKKNITAGAKSGSHASPEIDGGGKIQYKLEVKPKNKIKDKRRTINAWLQGTSVFDGEVDRIIGRAKNRP